MADEIVRYQFISAGEEQVLRSFESTASAADRAASRAQRAALAERRAVDSVLVSLRKLNAEKAKAGGAGVMGHKEELRAARAAVAEQLRLQRQLTRRTETEARRRARSDSRFRQRGVAGLRGAAGEVGTFGLRSALGALGVGVTGSLGIIGARAAGRLVRENTSFNDLATRLAIKGRGVAGQPEFTGAQVRNQIQAVAAERGVKAVELAEGIDEIVKRTGDLAGALGSADDLARFSIATGADLRDLGGTFVEVQRQFGLHGREAAEAVAVLAKQGKEGSVEIADFAAKFGRVAGAARALGIEGTAEGVAQVGGLLQMTGSAGVGGDVAETGLRNFFTTLAKKSGQIKQDFGVEVFDKGGKFRGIENVIPELIGKVGSDPSKLFKLFDQRASIVANVFSRIFNDAGKDIKDPAARVKEGMRALTEALHQATSVDDALQSMEADFQEASKTTDVQLTQLSETLNQAFQNEVLPAIISIVPQLINMVPALEMGISALGSFADVVGSVASFLGEKFKDTSPYGRLKELDKQEAQTRSKYDVLEGKFIKGGYEALTDDEIREMDALQGQLTGIGRERGAVMDTLMTDQSRPTSADDLRRAGIDERIIESVAAGQTSAYQYRDPSFFENMGLVGKLGGYFGGGMPVDMPQGEQVDLLEQFADTLNFARMDPGSREAQTIDPATGELRDASKNLASDLNSLAGPIGALSSSVESAATRINSAKLDSGGGGFFSIFDGG